MKPLFVKELKTFPPPQMTLAEGILDVSDDLRVERLLEAYSFGIFPWPHQGLPTVWYCPEERGVLDFKNFHLPKSLKKFLAHTTWTYSFNRCFDEVVEACSAQPRPGQLGTWLTKKMIKAYREFHRAGYAHSLEVWDGADLIGGLYGVYVGGLFCGESMFHRRTNASKCALVKLVEYLKSSGLDWMDIQMVTPLLSMLGGKYVSRNEFLRRLRDLRKVARPLDFKI